MQTVLIVILLLLPYIYADSCQSLGNKWGQQIKSPYIESDAQICIFSTVVKKAQLFSISTFSVTSIWANGTGITGARFQARLFGATITTVNVVESLSDPGVYVFSFIPRDPGQHWLQIRLSWFTHRHEYDEVTPSKSTSYIPFRYDYFDHVIYNHSIYLYRHPTLPSDSFQQRQSKPLCLSGTEDGRWVKIDPLEPCPAWICHYSNDNEDVTSSSSSSTNSSSSSNSSRRKKYVDNTAWLSDKFGFNKNYVWSPWNCSYRIMSVTEVGQCLKKKNIQFIGMIGDSLLRENLQNLFSLMVPEYTHSRLKGVKTTFQLPLPITTQHLCTDGEKEKENEKKISNTSNSNSNSNGNSNSNSNSNDKISDTEAIENRTLSIAYHYNYPEAGCKHIDVVHREKGSGIVLWNWPVIKTINSGWYMKELKQRLYGRIRKQFDQIMCTDSSSSKSTSGGGGRGDGHSKKSRSASLSALPSIYILHPRVQRMDLRAHLLTENPFNKVTPMRQDALMQNLSEFIQSLDDRVRILDGMVLSESRWESSWDGIHYGVSVHSHDFEPFNQSGSLSQQHQALNNTCSHGGEHSRSPGGYDVCSLAQHNNYNFCIGDRMYWCNNVVGRSNPFDSFEGGVSRMTTMVWLNMICNIP